ALKSAMRSKLLAPGNVPTDGTVVLGVVEYKDAAFPFMPWTQVTSPQVLSAFANRLARQALPGGGNNRMIEGIQASGAQFARSTMPGAYRHLVLVTDEPGMMGSGAITWPRDAIDALYTQGLID